MSSVDTPIIQAAPRRTWSKGIWTFGIVFTFVAAGATAFAVYWKASQPGGPRLRLSTSELDMGQGLPGDELSGSFDIKNDGVEILKYELRASCGCTQLKPKEGELKPGETQQVAIGLRLPAILGTEKKAAVFINCNDPKRSTASFQIRGGCPFPFRVTPDRIQLASEPGAKQFSQRLTVDENGELQFRDVADLKIDCPAEHCRVTDVRKSGTQLQIDVAIESLPDQRDTKFYISLKHATDSREMHIPVQILQSDSIIAVPKKQIVRFDEAEQTKELHTWIIAKNGKRLGSVSVVDPPPGIEVTPQTTESSKVGYTIKVNKATLAAETFTLKFRCHSSEGDCVLAQDFDIRRS